MTGVDLLEEHLLLARARYPQLGERLQLLKADAFALPFTDGTFDLTVSRHVLQAIPDPPRALAELVRVTRPGGFLHVLAEDYAMADIVTDGRVIMGVGRGYHSREVETFGAPVID